MRFVVFALAVATCYSLSDLRNAECRVACRARGHDDGFSAEERCRCIDDYARERITEKRLTLPTRSQETRTEKTPPYHFTVDD